ncbi:hypothetical protein D3C87_2014600 [compost metagenome]
MQSAGDFQFVVIDRHDGLGRQQGQRISTNDHRHVQILTQRLDFLKEGQRMAW